MLQFLVQKKKKDAEERRARQKKAQEDFRKMLEVSWLLLLDVVGSLGFIISLPRRLIFSSCYYPFIA